MNLQRTGFGLLAFAFMLLFASEIRADPVPKLTILTEEWEPYNFTKDGEIKGISTDILVLMLEKIGSPQSRKDIGVYPWVRAYKMAQDTPGTVLFTTSWTEERDKMFKWVGPIFENETNVYALKSRGIKISSLKELEKYKIGSLRGDATEELLVKKTGMKVSDFEQVATRAQNMKKLSMRRVDLVAQSKESTISASKEAGLNPDDFEAVINLDKKKMYYAFHKDTPDSVISLFQTAFDDLKNKGKVTEVLRKYGK